MREDAKQVLIERQKEFERLYGVKPLPTELLEMQRANREKKQCLECCGLPRRKEENLGQYPEVILENGRYYVISKICRYWSLSMASSLKAGLPRRYADQTYADYIETADNAAAIKAARRYAQDKPLKWLYVYGGCGTGKTFLISLLGKELIGAGLEVVFTDFQSILEELKDSFDDKAVTTSAVLDKYETCEVLILDDVGTGWFRDWGVSVLHQIIDTRYNAERRTIITSNYDMDDLEERLSMQEKYAARRIISRLREMSEDLYMGEADWRNGAC